MSPSLPPLSLPVEVMWAPGLPEEPQYGQRLTEDLPGARLARFEDTSHVVPADQSDVVA